MVCYTVHHLASTITTLHPSKSIYEKANDVLYRARFATMLKATSLMLMELFSDDEKTGFNYTRRHCMYALRARYDYTRLCERNSHNEAVLFSFGSLKQDHRSLA